MKANKMFLFLEKHQKQKKIISWEQNSPFQSFFFACVVFFPSFFLYWACRLRSTKSFHRVNFIIVLFFLFFFLDLKLENNLKMKLK